MGRHVTFRYIGSKARIVGDIVAHVGSPSGQGFFVDVFCGTGVVAEAAAHLGWSVRLNDHLFSAVTMAAARLVSDRQAQFRELGGYAKAIARLNRLKPVQGFIWREYSPATRSRLGMERRYFTEPNAGKIDAIRLAIRRWKEAGDISVLEERLLIADLLSAVLANTGSFRMELRYS
jgi:adenine-specific DNA-methyltransferase